MNCPKCDTQVSNYLLGLTAITWKCVRCDYLWEVPRKHKSTEDDGDTLACPQCGDKTSYLDVDEGTTDCLECGAILHIDVEVVRHLTAYVLEEE